MKTKIMNKKSVVVTIGLMLTASLSGCFSNDNGSSADEPGSIYEPGPYEVLKYENITFANGLAHKIKYRIIYCPCDVGCLLSRQ